MSALDEFLTELERGALIGLFTWSALLLGGIGVLVAVLWGRRPRRGRYVRGAAKAPRTWRGQVAVGRVRLDGDTRVMPRYDDESVTG
ncbi:hypothetical protein [Micromonospora sp. NPDC047730]|uniref:hypothetical protein n=1 Tax=Micromonospora sp. NPDC047730 TaxID=3364253 RepID=UPI00371DCB61